MDLMVYRIICVKLCITFVFAVQYDGYSIVELRNEEKKNK